MPGQVAGYTCQVTNQPDLVIQALPTDTSFGRCQYTAPDGFWSCANVVLMGTDRSSIHKPQECLTGQGWKLDDTASQVEHIRMLKPSPYDLPVMRLTGTLEIQDQGQARTLRGVCLLVRGRGQIHGEKRADDVVDGVGTYCRPGCWTVLRTWPIFPFVSRARRTPLLNE